MSWGRNPSNGTVLHKHEVGFYIQTPTWISLAQQELCWVYKQTDLNVVWTFVSEHLSLITVSMPTDLNVVWTFVSEHLSLITVSKLTDLNVVWTFVSEHLSLITVSMPTDLNVVWTFVSEHLSLTTVNKLTDLNVVWTFVSEHLSLTTGNKPTDLNVVWTFVSEHLSLITVYGRWGLSHDFALHSNTTAEWLAVLPVCVKLSFWRLWCIDRYQLLPAHLRFQSLPYLYANNLASNQPTCLRTAKGDLH